MKGIMLQGTSSDVGKSVIATALCRIFANKNKKVAPFKSQNMSNNSYVTKDGKEIGRAQGIQAEAARTDASIYMNPILLKPRSDQIAEVVRFGKRYETLSGKNYREQFYDIGMETIKESLAKLRESYDYLVIEGAGSPVEVNLNDREMVNMKVAELADVPVVLIADIDRGGVFASIVGTLELLKEQERKRVIGIIINKFRGDINLFTDGIRWIENYTKVKVLGVVPHITNITIEGEDSLSIASQFKRSLKEESTLDIAVIQLPYVSNYTDLEPFRFEDDVNIRFVSSSSTFGNPDAVIIPGTKSTFHDLAFLKKQGLDTILTTYADQGGTLIGLCGGYQMLGETLVDVSGTDTGEHGKETTGLGIAPLQTYFVDEKTTVRSVGTLVHPIKGIPATVEGFEIHLGRTEPKGEYKNAFLLVNGQKEGIYLANGKVIGTYFHHLFHNDDWRTAWLNNIRKEKGMAEKNVLRLQENRDASYDHVAKVVEAAIDFEFLLHAVENWGTKNEQRV